MPFTNIELKARTNDPGFIRQYLLDHGADFKGTDTQVDTYFNTTHGRLKLRQGNVENSLIHYNRQNGSHAKQSDVQLMELTDAQPLKEILTRSAGIQVIVEKKREIYYIENVKFHIDHLMVLGNFIEIEASNKTHPLSLEVLHEQCAFYKNALHIMDDDLIDISYSDMLLSNTYGSI